MRRNEIYPGIASTILPNCLALSIVTATPRCLPRAGKKCSVQRHDLLFLHQTAPSPRNPPGCPSSCREWKAVSKTPGACRSRADCRRVAPKNTIRPPGFARSMRPAEPFAARAVDDHVEAAARFALELPRPVIVLVVDAARRAEFHGARSLSVEPLVTNTVFPAATANCNANSATPPPTPLMSTRFPGRNRHAHNRAR